MYVSNMCYTIGVKTANPVIGAAWQVPTHPAPYLPHPSDYPTLPPTPASPQCAAPIATAAICIALGLERATPRKLAGIAAAFAGAVFIVFFEQDVSLSSSAFVGNILFFFNILGYSGYVILSKPLGRTLPYVTVTAWSMLIVAALLFVTLYITHYVDALHHTICRGCGIWDVGDDEVWALSYFVLVYSVMLYVSITWANQFVPSSTVASYTVFQPGMAAAFCAVLIENGFNESHRNVQLEEPSWNALGMVGVLLGLGLLVSDGARQRRAAEAAAEAAAAAAVTHAHGDPGGSRGDSGSGGARHSSATRYSSARDSGATTRYSSALVSSARDSSSAAAARDSSCKGSAREPLLGGQA
jgi:hypothetical protein